MTCRILLNRGAPLFSCKRGRLGVSLAILLFVARLSAGSELPSIPELTESDLQQFAPFLRQELVRAYKRLKANPKTSRPTDSWGSFCMPTIKTILP